MAGLVTAVGGLVVLGAGSSAWVREVGQRQVQGVAVPESVTTAGSALAPGVTAVGVAALLAGLVLLAVRAGVARRLLGVVAVLLGLGALAVTATGVLVARELPGALTSGPGTAALGGALALVGGALALRPPRPRTATPAVSLDPGEREDDADEWHLASIEPDDRA